MSSQPSKDPRRRLLQNKKVANVPDVLPRNNCQLKLLKLNRLNDWLEMEKAFVNNIQLIEEKEEKASDILKKRLIGSHAKVFTLEEILNGNRAIVSRNTVNYYVEILDFVDKSFLQPGCNVLCHHTSYAIIGVLPSGEDDADVATTKIDTCPTETFADIGGLEKQIEEIKECVEWPLIYPELWANMGIAPPKGVILYGPPGTGKTLLAKAVANSTSASFHRITGSELVKKYLGEGPKLVRNLFRAAIESAPSIVFIDEIDAIGAKRREAHSSGEAEVQRTMLELLNQLDGFDDRGDVKVIFATNLIESLDPALIRPGRIDRKIEIPLPDAKTRLNIFRIHTSKMTLADDVDLEELSRVKDELSGADVKAICSEAGLIALREGRLSICMQDFIRGKDLVLYKKKDSLPEGLYI